MSKHETTPYHIPFPPPDHYQKVVPAWLIQWISHMQFFPTAPQMALVLAQNHSPYSVNHYHNNSYFVHPHCEFSVGHLYHLQGVDIHTFSQGVPPLDALVVEGSFPGEDARFPSEGLSFILSKPQCSHNSTQPQPNITLVGLDKKWLCKPPHPSHPTETQCLQYLTCFWPDFDETFK